MPIGSTWTPASTPGGTPSYGTNPEAYAAYLALVGQLQTASERAYEADLQAQTQMDLLNRQIEAQGGLATQDQAAQMARLQAQLAGQLQQIGATGEQSRLTSAQEAQQAQSLAGLQAGLQRETEQQRFGRAQQESSTAYQRTQDLLNQLGLIQTGQGTPLMMTGAAGGGTPSGAITAAGAAPSAGVGGNLGGMYDSLDAADQAAEAAAFARAKDRIGQSQEAAMRGLQEAVSSRGIGGSGLEAQLTRQTLESGAGQLAEAATQQQQQALQRRYQVSDQERALGMQKRGQDVGLVQSLSQSYAPRGGGVY